MIFSYMELFEYTYQFQLPCCWIKGGNEESEFFWRYCAARGRGFLYFSISMYVYTEARPTEDHRCRITIHETFAVRNVLSGNAGLSRERVFIAVTTRRCTLFFQFPKVNINGKKEFHVWKGKRQGLK